ncbi:hypothetical protein CEXT_243461 [Caerostris extrusa]|uniref:Uncharacterized protein n=1 Tax=Caerostris extrusa TaxID=172846 RepID=A0AAV4U1C6_CAEEX|nr:hypothetical protein CEXT_243461 [Caerostris extrusa]
MYLLLLRLTEVVSCRFPHPLRATATWRPEPARKQSDSSGVVSPPAPPRSPPTWMRPLPPASSSRPAPRRATATPPARPALAQPVRGRPQAPLQLRLPARGGLCAREQGPVGQVS